MPSRFATTNVLNRHFPYGPACDHRRFISGHCSRLSRYGQCRFRCHDPSLRPFTSWKAPSQAPRRAVRVTSGGPPYRVLSRFHSWKHGLVHVGAANANLSHQICRRMASNNHCGMVLRRPLGAARTARRAARTRPLLGLPRALQDGVQSVKNSASHLIAVCYLR
jgi:hypothetical protein